MAPVCSGPYRFLSRPPRSALFRLGSLVWSPCRAQHAQEALRDFLLQEVLPELTQRRIQLGVAVRGCGPVHWLGLAILGQRALSLDSHAGRILLTSVHMTIDVVNHSRHVPQQLAPTPCGAYDNGPGINKFPALFIGEMAVLRRFPAAA